MHKILLAFLLSAVFLFPKSEVLAVSECTNEQITQGLIHNGNRANAESCPDGTDCFQKTGSVFNCKKVAAPDAAPAGGAGGTTSNTSGSGQPCDLNGGKPLNLPPGTAVPPNSGIYTAIGCIPTEPKALVEGLLKYGTVAAGAIAFLLMLLGAIGMITAEGNPEAIKNAQERFYSAIVGLLLIIFSVLLMQVIGVDILGLPGFGR